MRPKGQRDRRLARTFPHRDRSHRSIACRSGHHRARNRSTRLLCVCWHRRPFRTGPCPSSSARFSFYAGRTWENAGRSLLAPDWLPRRHLVPAERSTIAVCTCWVSSSCQTRRTERVQRSLSGLRWWLPTRDLARFRRNDDSLFCIKCPLLPLSRTAGVVVDSGGVGREFAKKWGGGDKAKSSSLTYSRQSM